MGRRLKGKLPTSVSLLTPEGVVRVHSQLIEKQEKQKMYFDRQTKTLSDLQAGENVRVQKRGTRQSAVVLHKHEQPQSFVVSEKTFHVTDTQDPNLSTDPGMKP